MHGFSTNCDRSRDLQESLEYQTATSEVLKVISRSDTELGSLLDTLLETAARICAAERGNIYRLHDGQYQLAASYGIPDEFKDVVMRTPLALDRGSVVGRSALEQRVVHIEDEFTDPEYRPELPRLGQYHTAIGVPLLREDAAIGVFALARSRVEPFNERQIALVTTFADQAVIAIENARLLGELRQRTSDLQVSLEYQTATGDVLKVISRSGSELDAVLDTLVETAARICEADKAAIHQLRDTLYSVAASFGFTREYEDYVARNPVAPGRGTATGRMALERRVVHIEDALHDPEYTGTEYRRLGQIRTMLAVPLFREDTIIGSFLLARSRVESFTEKQIELVTTFADQAVIAIENARLLGEIRQRQAELRVTFDNMADGVVRFDDQLRLAAWNRNLVKVLDLPDAFLAEPRTYADYVRFLAQRGEFGAVDPEAELRRLTENAGRQWTAERTRPDGRVLEVRHNPVPGGGFVLIYSDITERKQAEARLRAARDTAEAALRELKTAQASLIHAEKMASLGQLTAGIAHEIKNPLNFVNNFADLSVELLDELKEAAAPAVVSLGNDMRAEIDEVAAMLTGNLEKIAEHGRRADGIVKSMLAHSRGGSGERQTVEINSLVDESLNLAYHGARAQDQNFNVILERDLDHSIAPIEAGCDKGDAQPVRQWLLRRQQTVQRGEWSEIQAEPQGDDMRPRLGG